MQLQYENTVYACVIIIKDNIITIFTIIWSQWINFFFCRETLHGISYTINIANWTFEFSWGNTSLFIHLNSWNLFKGKILGICYTCENWVMNNFSKLELMKILRWSRRGAAIYVRVDGVQVESMFKCLMNVVKIYLM